jgi:hypothetical protein
MGRSIGAIAVGFIFIVVLSLGADAVLRLAMPGSFDTAGRVTQTSILFLMLAYVGAFSISGCYLTARLAPGRPRKHALILGGLGLLFSIPGTVFGWSLAPPWYHITSLVMIMPYAWLGGLLGQRRNARRSGAGGDSDRGFGNGREH